jgi:predicted PurR-regulated permease PerM
MWSPAINSSSKPEVIMSVSEPAGQRLLIHAAERSLQWKTVVVVMTACVVLLAFYGLWLTRVAVLVVFAGLLVSIALTNICKFIEARTHLRRRWSLPFVLFAAISLLTLAIWLRGPAIEGEIDRLQTSLPQAASAFMAQLRAQGWGQWLLAHGFAAEQIPRIMDVVPKVTGIVSGT